MVRYETAGVRATITIDDPERRNPLSTANPLTIARNGMVAK